MAWLACSSIFCFLGNPFFRTSAQNFFNRFGGNFSTCSFLNHLGAYSFFQPNLVFVVVPRSDDVD